MKVNVAIVVFAFILLLSFNITSISAETGIQELTLQYGVNQGDIFTWEIMTIEEGYEGGGDLYAEGDEIKLEVIGDVSEVKGEFDEFIFTTWKIIENEELFKEISSNGTEKTLTESILIYPIRGDLENGTELTLFDLLYFDFYLFGSVSQFKTHITVTFTLGNTVTINYDSENGIATSQVFEDPEGRKVVVERARDQ